MIISYIVFYVIIILFNNQPDVQLYMEQKDRDFKKQGRYCGKNLE